MRSRTYFRSAALVAVVGLFSACGEDSSGPDYMDEMNSADAYNAAEQVFGNIQTAFTGMDFGSPGVGILVAPAMSPFAGARGRRAPTALASTFDLRSPGALRDGLQAAMDDGCTVTAGGFDEEMWDPIDANGNEVPDDWTIKVICVQTNENEGVVQLDSVKYGIRIKERTSGLFGFDANAYYISHEAYSDGDDEHWGYDQTHNVVVQAGGATAKYRYHEFEKYFNDGVLNDFERTVETDLAFDPDGTIVESIPDGSLTIDGYVEILENDVGNRRFELSTPEPWEYSTACANDPELETSQRFVGGVLLAAFGGDAETGFTLTWLACGDGHDISLIGDDVVLPPESKDPSRR